MRGRWLMAGVAFLGAAGVCAAQDPLAAYRWKSRLLVISAPDASDPKVRAQRDILASAQAGSRERDLVTVEALGKGREAVRLRASLGLPDDAFRVVLVGKDGGPKRTGAEPLSANTLFATIDAMPMRQDERRR